LLELQIELFNLLVSSMNKGKGVPIRLGWYKSREVICELLIDVSQRCWRLRWREHGE
jgi:hypothetical protein